MLSQYKHKKHRKMENKNGKETKGKKNVVYWHRIPCFRVLKHFFRFGSSGNSTVHDKENY